MFNDGKARKSKLSRLLTAGSEPLSRHRFETNGERCLDPPLDYPALSVNHLHLGQPHQVTRMVDPFSGTLAGDLVVLTQERRQLQCLQVVAEQNLRCVGHAVTPVRSSM